jgi:hypothetical protein
VAVILTWRLPGGPPRAVRGHEAAVQELFTVLADAGATDLALAPETPAEGREESCE